MSNRIEFTNWERTQSVARALINEGYQVLIASDGETFGADEVSSYSIEYINPKFGEGTFVLVEEE